MDKNGIEAKDIQNFMRSLKLEKNLKKEIGKVVDYLWHDEEKHWEEDGKPRNHIFIAVRRINNWLKQFRCEKCGKIFEDPEEIRHIKEYGICCKCCVKEHEA